MMVSIGILGAGLLALALAPTWSLFLSAAFLTGVGYGAIDFGVYSLLSRSLPERRTFQLSIIGSGWGIGSVIAPLVVAVIGAKYFHQFFFGAGVCAMLLIYPVQTIVSPHSKDRVLSLRMSKPSAKLLSFFTLIIFLYVALETAVAGWTAPQLTHWRFSPLWGQLSTAGFWAGIAIGRLLGPAWSRRLGEPMMALIGIVSCCVVIPFASVRYLGAFVYPASGFCMSVMFPMTLAWFNNWSAEPENGVAMILALTMAGGAAGPALESILVSQFGYGAVPWAAEIFAVACAITCLLVYRNVPSQRSDHHLA